MITYGIVVSEFIKQAKRHLNQREAGGKNRSSFIDELCKRGQVPLATPYCMLGVSACVEDACKSLGLKSPIKVQVGTQWFWVKTPEQYRRMSGKRGMIGIYQLRSDRDRGHAVICADNEDIDFQFQAIEFNVSKGGSRDGDGVYVILRSAHGDAKLVLRGFVDIAQWICDVNGISG